MSKNKKRRTRKEKEKSRRNQREYLSKYAGTDSKIETDAPSPDAEAEPSKAESHQLPSSEISSEARYIVSDTKRSIILALSFFAILVILYFLEQKFNYFGPLASRLISILVR
jgi:hypothetical protein